MKNSVLDLLNEIPLMIISLLKYDYLPNNFYKYKEIDLFEIQNLIFNKYTLIVNY